MVSILRRTIFFELVRVFLMALVALTGLLLLAGIVAEASQRGLGPGQILSVIPLLIPSTLPYTLPATTLFATCVVYGRLAHDNEILAIKAAGINILQVIWPGIFLGVLASACTICLYFDIIPETHHMLRSQVMNDLEEYLYSMLRREGRLKLPKVSYEIYVKKVDGRKLIEAQFMRRDLKGHFDIIARAAEAELRVDLKGKQILVDMRRCHISSDNNKDRSYVGMKVWACWELPDDPSKQKQRATDMTWSEMWEERDRLQEEIDKLDVDMAAHKARIAMGNAPEEFGQHVRDLMQRKRYFQGLARAIDVEMQMRPALGVGCLCFVLVGCPVGIWFSRSDYLSAFITCFLPIVFIYYPLLLCSLNMAKGGRVEPGLIIWAANGVMAVAAAFMFRRLLKN